MSEINLNLRKDTETAASDLIGELDTLSLNAGLPLEDYREFLDCLRCEVISRLEQLDDEIG